MVQVLCYPLTLVHLDHFSSVDFHSLESLENGQVEKSLQPDKETILIPEKVNVGLSHTHSPDNDSLFAFSY